MKDEDLTTGYDALAKNDKQNNVPWWWNDLQVALLPAELDKEDVPTLIKRIEKHTIESERKRILDELNRFWFIMIKDKTIIDGIIDVVNDKKQ